MLDTPNEGHGKTELKQEGIGIMNGETSRRDLKTWQNPNCTVMLQYWTVMGKTHSVKCFKGTNRVV